jgi:acetylornithine deacetylase/succinyl-diaminopimelate desuccinylase-like protein
MTSYGIPVVDNVGAAGTRSHSVDEYARISSLLESAKRIIAAVIYL